MSMLGRRGLLKSFGLLPLAGAGKHKREPDVGWSNDQFQLLIVNAQVGGFSGEFTYSPGPGAGNLIYSNTARAGTDPYGNHYLAGTTWYQSGGVINVNDGVQLTYAPTAALGNLIASISPSLGTDSFGNAYLNGVVTYQQLGTGVFRATEILGASIQFETASSAAGPWTGEGIIQSGDFVNAGINAVSITQVALTESPVAPPTPTASGTLYVDGTGHLHYLGPGGTNTILANP